MNHVQLSISIEEANILLQSLQFVKKSMALNAKNLVFQFVPGAQLALSIGEQCRLQFLNAYIEEARADALDSHPFNPFINNF